MFDVCLTLRFYPFLYYNQMKRIDWIVKVMQKGFIHKVVYAGHAIKIYRNLIDEANDKAIAIVILWDYPTVKG